ncbi:MAG: hypothetical protein IKI19_05705 [Prevotella sp.]|nr:hypothetical protein [Prevotella sp.]
MARLKYLFLMVSLTLSVTASAAWKVVVDPWTTAQVAANAASQQLIEDKHNERLDSIDSKQQKIMKYTAVMQQVKELYRMSMQNISGFGEETKYYGEICQTTWEIMEAVPVVLDYIGHSPVKNYVLCVSEIAGVVTETESLVADFVDIVNNGKIRNPLKKGKTLTECPKCGNKLETIDTGNADRPHVYVCRKCGFNTDNNVVADENAGDGYNLLNRYERLTVANRIYARLLTIKYKMDYMALMCQYCSGIGDVLMAVDVESWAVWFTGKAIVDRLINDWNSLGV